MSIVNHIGKGSGGGKRSGEEGGEIGVSQNKGIDGMASIVGTVVVVNVYRYIN